MPEVCKKSWSKRRKTCQDTHIDSIKIFDMLILFSRRYTKETLEYSRIVHLLVSVL